MGDHAGPGRLLPGPASHPPGSDLAGLAPGQRAPLVCVAGGVGSLVSILPLGAPAGKGSPGPMIISLQASC